MTVDRGSRFAAVLALLTLSGCAAETAKAPPPAADPPVAAAPAERAQPASAPAPAPPPPAAAPAPASPAAPSSPPPRMEFAEQPALMDVPFDSGQADVGRLGAAIMKNNARWLMANPGYTVLIEGHSDYKGSADSQLSSGERRAKAAMAFLIKEGVPMARIQIVSVGASRPVCEEKTEACAAKNRRVHFLVKPPQ